MLILTLRPGSVSRLAEETASPLDVMPGPLVTALAADLERSVLRNFRSGGRPIPWPLSRRAQETGKKTLIDQGLLYNSIRRHGKGYEAVVFTQDKRAFIHEYGGTIVPRTAKALTIPIAAEARGRRARSFADTFLLKRDGKAPLIMQRVEGGDPKPLFVLLKSVTLPARPFIEPPEQDIQQTMVPRIRRWMDEGAV
ncbi:MAG: hypothetical protein PHI18_00165 [bacterium]|nr:hypothetical protein [bacterium]